MSTKRTRKLAAWTLTGVVAVAAWFAWPRVEPVEARLPERPKTLSPGDTPTALRAAETADGTPRDAVALEEPAVERTSPAQEAEQGPWVVRVYAETDSGSRFSVDRSVVVATHAHPGSGAIAPVPEPHVAYGAGVWRPQDDSRTASVLEIFEAAPVYASLVIGATVLDTILLRGGEEKIVFVVSKLLIEQSKGTFTFQVVDVSTGETPKNDGFMIAARSLDPGPTRFPFRNIASTRLGDYVQGPYTLYLGGIYYGEQRIEFDIVAGRHIDLGVIELVSTGGIRGQVENPAGEILDIRVIARRSGQPSPVGGGDFYNFGERFYLGSLPPGEIWVTTDSPDWACFPIRFEVHEGILEDAVVPAHEGTRLTLERAYTARGRTRATILTVGGQVAWHGTLDVGESAKLRLVPGSYTLLTEPGEERTITIAGGEQHIEL